MKTGTAIVSGPRFTLLLLWIFLTAFNINKAWHIDDTFHLEAAEWIKDHPASPMSGFVNWDQSPEPLFYFNQPPLFFYLIAGVMKVVGDNPILLHLFLSLFTFLCLYFFLKIAELLSLKQKHLLLFFFALNPAFIVNQNLMTDVPLLSMILGFAFYVLKAGQLKITRAYIPAAIFAGLACLIKYSALPLIPVLLLVLLLRREFKALPVVLIPLGFLFLWSFWNYQQFGSAHIFGRHKQAPQVKHLFDFINCLGAVSVFSLPFVYGLLPNRWMKWFLITLVIISISVIVFAATNTNYIPEINKLLNYAFTINGGIIVVTLSFLILKKLANSSFESIIASPLTTLLLIASALSIFIILFAPFMATRHLLLILPFLLLLGDEWLSNLQGSLKTVVLTLTVLLAVSLSCSDWLYADFYRTMAKKIQVPSGKNTWYAGHWGWQRYAQKKDWKQYDPEHSELSAGDYLIYPEAISRQAVHTEHLELIEKKWEQPSVLQFFSVSPARLYSSGTGQAPWILSRDAIDTVYIYRRL